jgi:hypothetical protein
MEALNLVTIAVLALGVLPLLLFIVFYASEEPLPGERWWRRRPRWPRAWVGRIVLAQKITLATLLSYLLIVRALDDFPGREWVSLGLFLILEAQFWAMFALLRHIQTHPPKE